MIQQVQYVLSNRVTFKNEDTKKKMGLDFDNQIQEAARIALIDGVSFLFWNLNHLEVFGFADTPTRPGFVPVNDAVSGYMRAGVRYWWTGNTALYTLYEMDGYTEYSEERGKDPQIRQPKRAYKTISVAGPKSRAEGSVEYIFENYPGFPTISMFANDLQESEFVGIRESIDYYDFVKFGFANDIDDTTGFYWILKNAGGMDDVDIAKFLDRMRKVRAAALDTDDGVDAAGAHAGGSRRSARANARPAEKRSL